MSKSIVHFIVTASNAINGRADAVAILNRIGCGFMLNISLPLSS
jgi:hypothetical protein